MGGRSTVLLVGWLIWICQLEPSLGVKNNLKVTFPPSLRGDYNSRIRWLGVPQFGGILSGFIVHPPETNLKACSKFPEESGAYYNSLDRPPILLVDGGDCDFSTKTFHAQLATAIAVLIVDDRDEQVIFARDEEFVTSANISIPTAIISKSLADRIKGVPWYDGVRIELDLPVDHGSTILSDSEDVVRYSLWMGIGLGCSQSKCDLFNSFIQEFREVAKMLERRGLAKFSPHYITWSWNRVRYEQDPHWGSCSMFNSYHVAFPQKEDYHGTVWREGKDVLVQSLFQACFFKVADEIGKPWLWWDYMGEFISRCLPSNGTYSGAWCAEEIINSLGVDLHMVYECFGGTNPDLRHPLFEPDQAKYWKKFGTGRIIGGFPVSLVVDEYLYIGFLDYHQVLQHICRRIREKIPEICPTEDLKLDVVRSIEYGSLI